MANFITSSGEELASTFMNDSSLIDRFIGNQIWTWGDNTYGQLGDNSKSYATAKSSPVQVSGNQTNWIKLPDSISASATHIGAIRYVTTGSNLWLWGNNNSNQINVTAYSGLTLSYPLQIKDIDTENPPDFLSITDVSPFQTTVRSNTAFRTFAKGSGEFLGNGSTAGSKANSLLPFFNSGGANILKEVSIGLDGGVAIQANTGILFSIGSANIAPNGTTGYWRPAQQVVPTGYPWSTVSAGDYHVAGITTDGRLWSWGRNNYGQLGNTTITVGSTVNTYTQLQGSSNNWSKVSAGSDHTAAIKTDGSLWLWGRNDYGQLGDGTVIHRSSPVQIIAGGKNWKQVSSGYRHTAAIKTDGSLWCWGKNDRGELGDGTIIHRSSPVQTVLAGKNWKQVAAAKEFTAAITYYESFLT